MWRDRRVEVLSSDRHRALDCGTKREGHVKGMGGLIYG